MRTRKLLASIIVMFVNLITLPLSPSRRGDAKAMAHDFLAAPITVETEKGSLILDTSSRRCVSRARHFNTSEPDTLEWLNRIPDDACFWDIGANVGVYSLYAALGSKVHVLSFEPAASSFAVLNKNVELNGMSSQILAYCLAFSKNSKLDVLNMDDSSAGSSMHGFGTKINQLDEIIDIKFCQGAIGFSIDDFMKIFSPPQPTHVKIDVDGIEADILRGGRETLSKSTSIIIEIEKDLRSPRNQEIITLMTKLGFTARPKASPTLRNVIFDRP